MDYKVFESSEKNVWKYVFNFETEGQKPAVAEAVLYRYPDFGTRTVLCISVQSGCPVGCTFCGTGSRFVRNLTAAEIVEQVQTVLTDKGIEDIGVRCSKFQIMFMSMGEPFLNYGNVSMAIMILNSVYPTAQLLVSTIAPKQEGAMAEFITLSRYIPKIGLQFSVHEAVDADRNALIPYKNKLSLVELRNYGVQWWHETGRKPYCNYCVSDPPGHFESQELMKLFPANVFCFTFSVICSKYQTTKMATEDNCRNIQSWMDMFLEHGYDVRMFDPAGQSDIGGGCGQLWHFQKAMNINILTTDARELRSCRYPAPTLGLGGE